MTEEEWLSSTDPTPMLEFLRGKASDRKLKLLACSIVRLAPFAEDGRSMWEQAPEYDWFMQRSWQYTVDSNNEVSQTQELVQMNCHEAIEVVERSVDTPGMEAMLATAAFATFAARYHAEAGTSDYVPNPEPGADHQDQMASFFEMTATYPDAIHPLFTNWDRGSPESWLRSLFFPAISAILRCLFNPFHPIPLNPTWQTSTVLALAQGIYQDRAFDRLPILADALLDSECDNPDLLNHLRSEGPHTRGCWAIDLLTNRE
jgi:hypothetical protein